MRDGKRKDEPVGGGGQSGTIGQLIDIQLETEVRSLALRVGEVC